MKKYFKNSILIFGLISFLFLLPACRAKKNENQNISEKKESDPSQAVQDRPTTSAEPKGKSVNAIFLHHSVGEVIWNGGVVAWFKNYNVRNGTGYEIGERNFPKESLYGWENYPYDYWNIWVNHAGENAFEEEPTLEILTKKYDLIILKHCYPVSEIEADSDKADVASTEKTLANYRLQYEALKVKMREFPENKFLVWTGAAEVKNATNEEKAKRAREFFSFVKEKWDEKGDNIFVFDFYGLETEGGLYLKDEYAASLEDSHPNEEFAQKVAPLFSERVVEVIESRGDSENIDGQK